MVDLSKRDLVEIAKERSGVGGLQGMVWVMERGNGVVEISGLLVSEMEMRRMGT